MMHTGGYGYYNETDDYLLQAAIERSLQQQQTAGVDATISTIDSDLQRAIEASLADVSANGDVAAIDHGDELSRALALSKHEEELRLREEADLQLALELSRQVQ